jgi:hypothetical protein
MLARQVRLARGVARFLEAHPGYELLAQGEGQDEGRGDDAPAFENTHIIVIFRAKDDVVNEQLVKRINSTRKIYVSGTKWQGQSACRIAVSTWKVDVERDLSLIGSVLEAMVRPGMME